MFIHQLIIRPLPIPENRSVYSCWRLGDKHGTY